MVLGVLLQQPQSATAVFYSPDLSFPFRNHYQLIEDGCGHTHVRTGPGDLRLGEALVCCYLDQTDNLHASFTPHQVHNHKALTKLGYPV